MFLKPQVLFLKRYFNRPLHLFGKFGLVFSFIGFIINIYLSYKWILFNYFSEGLKYSINRPLLFLGMKVFAAMQLPT